MPFSKPNFSLEPDAVIRAAQTIVGLGINNMSKRSDILDGAPLHYAPENELGVVFLKAERGSGQAKLFKWL